MLSSITFMKEVSLDMSTLPLTPVLYASRIMYSNLSTSTEFRLFATISHRNRFPSGASLSLLVIRFHTRRTTSLSSSILLSSTIHSNISADIASWLQAAFFGSQLRCRRGKNSLSKTWLKGPWPKSWHSPASWIDNLSTWFKLLLTIFPLLRLRASYMFVARWQVPRECSNRLCEDPGKT